MRFLKVRYFLIAAVLLGLLLAAEKLRRVSRFRSEKAAELKAEAESWEKDAVATERLLADSGELDGTDRRVRIAEIRDAIGGYRSLSLHARRLADAWRAGANRPWLPMPPEPPPPE